MKAVLLAAGEGRRLAPLTDTRPKHMIPMGGKPLLQHTLEMLRSVGIKEILLIVGYLKEQIINYFQDGSALDLKITYTEQKEFLGTGHAAGLARDFAGKDPFFLIYGDLFMDVEIFQKSLEAYKQGNCHATIAAFKVPDPNKFGIIKTNSVGLMEEIIEKPPDDRYGNLANAGVYIFDSQIFEGIDKTEKSPRGEYELTESMQRCIDKGYRIRVVDISGYYWSDVGHPWQVLDANHYILSHISNPTPVFDSGYLQKNNITIEPNVTIKGNIIIGSDTLIKAGTYIEGPAFIGHHCNIGPNVHVRPYSAIGNHCNLGNSSEIKESILMDYSALPHLSYVGDSVIGEYVNFGCGTICANVRLDKAPVSMMIKDKKVATGRKKMGAVIGDHVSLGIQVSIMPGKTIGAYSQIGSSVVVSEDIPPYTLVYSKTELIKKPISK
jgi:bifunctional UDP-N-acetylglucosamine pyrophosphorylase/glucosamine-1-phosphate N-acetyltransferase